MRRTARTSSRCWPVSSSPPAVGAGADASLEPPLRAAIDAAARDALAATGAPSASVAVVRDGAIAYVQAYGSARLDPAEAARPAMRYSIGSVSKQFTATAILMLADEGKLSLDDPVGKFVPGLTRGDVVTIRQILSHTSGYQDYWPQDYVPPFMLQPTTAPAILDRWAKKPLDFEPGTQYQYSNTGYVIAGLIVEKASGRPLLPFLTERIFRPLGMASVANIDQERLGDTDPTGYLRYALGPPRVAPKEGKGWLFAAGELAMTAEDLARWNVAMLQQKLLKPESYRQQQHEVLRTDGLGISYGLGVDVTRRKGHRLLAHGGEVSGFTASNLVFPDDGVAVTVLVNQDSIDTAGRPRGPHRRSASRQGRRGPGRGAGAPDPPGSAVRPARPLGADRERERLLHGTGRRRFRREPRAARRSSEVKQTRSQRPRRNDLPALRGEVPAEEAGDRHLGTRHAGRQDRAVPGDGDGVVAARPPFRGSRPSRRSRAETFGAGFRSMRRQMRRAHADESRVSMLPGRRRDRKSLARQPPRFRPSGCSGRSRSDPASSRSSRPRPTDRFRAATSSWSSGTTACSWSTRAASRRWRAAWSPRSAAGPTGPCASSSTPTGTSTTSRRTASSGRRSRT